MLSQSASDPNTKNADLVKYNSKMAAYWQLRSSEFNRLISQQHIAEIARTKQVRALSNLQTLSSSERDIPFNLLTSYESEVLDLAPADQTLIVEGQKQKLPLFRAQQERACQPRIKIGQSEEIPLRTHLLGFLTKPEYQSQTAWELWAHFFAVLDELGCDPVAFSPADKRKARIEYYFRRAKTKCNSDGEPIRTFTFRRFANLVSELRNQSRLPGKR